METTVETSKQKEILEESLHNKLENRQGRINETLESIEFEGRRLEDFIVPSSSLEFESNGSLKVRNFDNEPTAFHSHALAQLSERFEIPTKYTRFLNSQGEWGAQLLENIFDEHRVNLPKKRFLFRKVEDEIKGVLSDRYKILNTILLMEAFLQAVGQSGAQVIDAAHGDTKSYMEAIIPSVVPIPTENNGTHYSVPGVQLRNSDFGDGAMEIKAFLMNVVCENGMVGKRFMREIHLGKQLPDFLSNQTIQKETEMLVSAVTDYSNLALSKDHIFQNFERIKELSAVEVDMQEEIKKLPKIGLTKDESAMTEKKLLENNPEDGIQGKNTKLKLVNAVTSTANEIKSQERKREIQELASIL